jgi:glycosyltransferase involved in cell wall biosynthesis
MRREDLLIVSPATTAGWRSVERELVASLERLHVPHRVKHVNLGRSRHLRRAWPLVDLVEASAARGALERGLAEGEPRAVVLLTSTAALLAPLGRLNRRGIAVAIRLDCPAAVNRPGRANAIQRGLERRRLRQARLVIAMGPRSAVTVSGLASEVVSLPVSINVPPAAAADPARVLCYVPDPAKKGLDVIATAWARVRRERDEPILTVAGQDGVAARRFLAKRGVETPAGVEWAGVSGRDEYLDLLRGSRAYVSASRREDHGIAQLEALAAGVPLVTTPSIGAYEAEPMARGLAPDLVTEDHDPETLAGALDRALEMTEEERRSYGQRAAELMAPFTPAACDAVLRDRVLPMLLA